MGKWRKGKIGEIPYPVCDVCIPRDGNPYLKLPLGIVTSRYRRLTCPSLVIAEGEWELILLNKQVGN